MQLQRMSSYNPQQLGSTPLSGHGPLRKMATVQHGSMVTTPVGPTGLKGQPRSAVLYSTGRSFSITTTQLEPTYPWDYDLDNDDLDEDVDEDEDEYEEYEDAEDEDLDAGEQYIIGDDEEEYQHPSLETRKQLVHVIMNMMPTSFCPHNRLGSRHKHILMDACLTQVYEEFFFLLGSHACEVVQFVKVSYT